REIEAGGAQPASEREVGPDRLARRDDDLVQMRVRSDDGRGERFDEVGDRGVGITLPQRAKGRRREDDVADLSEADEQDLQTSILGPGLPFPVSLPPWFRRSASPGCRP